MNLHIRLLAGSLVLAVTAAPALAGHSTAAEREATRQLNLEAAEMAKGSNASPLVVATDNSAPNSPPAAAPTTRVQSATIPDGASVVLSSLQHPPVQVANANVLDINGQTIGAVQRVEVTPEGVPTKVAIVLLDTNEKMVVLDAGAVKYDAAKNQVTAQQSAEEIKSRPTAG